MWNHNTDLILYFQEIASMTIQTNYEDFVNIGNIQVGPLNYAPHDTYSKLNEDLIPISSLRHKPSKKKDNCKKTILPFGCNK